MKLGDGHHMRWLGAISGRVRCGGSGKHGVGPPLHGEAVVQPGAAMIGISSRGLGGEHRGACPTVAAAMNSPRGGSALPYRQAFHPEVVPTAGVTQVTQVTLFP